MRRHRSYDGADPGHSLSRKTQAGFKSTWSAILILMAALLMAASAVRAQMMPPAAHYEGRWELQPNGDVKVTRTFKLPMQMYTMWKGHDVHMLEARNFAGERSSVEVTAKRADWDDLNQTLTLTMTVLGLCQNMGDHWEAKILPQIEFSNLDETRKIAYFHFSAESDTGRIQGQDLIVFPPACTKPSWDRARKVIVFFLPVPVTAWGGPAAGSFWWILSAVCLVAGIGLWVVSFLIKPAAHAKPEQAPVSTSP